MMIALNSMNIIRMNKDEQISMCNYKKLSVSKIIVFKYITFFI